MNTERIGFLRSESKPYLIENGNDGSTQQIDLEREYAFILIRCEDCSNIPDNTTLSLQVKAENSQTFCDLYEINDSGSRWTKNIPTTGTLHFIMSHAFGSRYIRLDLSNNVAGNVTFNIVGYDPVLKI